MSEEPLLTIRQAYDAMRAFLTVYWEESKSADLAGILGETLLHEDGVSYDPAASARWARAVREVVARDQQAKS